MITLPRSIAQFAYKDAGGVDGAWKGDLPGWRRLESEPSIIRHVADENDKLAVCCPTDVEGIGNEFVAISFAAVIRVDGQRAKKYGAGFAPDCDRCHTQRRDKLAIAFRDAAIACHGWRAFADPIGRACEAAGTEDTGLEIIDRVEIRRQRSSGRHGMGHGWRSRSLQIGGMERYA